MLFARKFVGRGWLQPAGLPDGCKLMAGTDRFTDFKPKGYPVIPEGR